MKSQEKGGERGNARERKGRQKYKDERGESWVQERR